MGYGDWSRGGHPTIRTPNLNRMADQGIQMTQYYSGNPVCSPSRAALLTGRNNIRTGILEVFFPNSERGLPLSELTIANALKPLGYSTGCIGKWHLGDHPEYRPLRRGFDYYYGLLYSNDMDSPDVYRNDERIQHPANQDLLTKNYTEEAIAFIERSKDKPFFLYLPYTMPHVPLHASTDFRGSSKRGLYGDAIEEIDWSVGQIMSTLDRLGLSENTLMMFTSDNGPWMIKNQRGGSAGLLRGSKGDTFEGGMREPFVARWPGRIPAGQIGMEIASTTDILPTIVQLAGGNAPSDRPIDGINIMPALEGKALPERPIYYYRGRFLRAVRKGKWKIHFSYYDKTKGDDMKPWVVPDTPMLFDLEADPAERFDLAAEHPEVVAEMKAIGEKYENEIRTKAENVDLVDWFRDVWPKAPRKATWYKNLPIQELS